MAFAVWTFKLQSSKHFQRLYPPKSLYFSELVLKFDSLSLSHTPDYWWKQRHLMPQPCSVSENTVATSQSSFWDPSDEHWDAHRIGWAVAGGCTVLVCSIWKLDVLLSFMLNYNHLQTMVISFVTILQHCRYAQVEGTGMLSLIHVRLGITQIHRNSDRCKPLCSWTS